MDGTRRDLYRADARLRLGRREICCWQSRLAHRGRVAGDASGVRSLLAADAPARRSGGTRRLGPKRALSPSLAAALCYAIRNVTIFGRAQSGSYLFLEQFGPSLVRGNGQSRTADRKRGSHHRCLTARTFRVLLLARPPS